MNGCKESVALINAMLEKSLRRSTTVSIYSDLLGIGSTMAESTLFTQDWLETRTA